MKNDEKGLWMGGGFSMCYLIEKKRKRNPEIGVKKTKSNSLSQIGSIWHFIEERVKKENRVTVVKLPNY